jgi:hypothetical protein
MKFNDDYIRIRKAGVPILAIETEDQPATINKIVTISNGSVAVIQWDIQRGIIGLNDEGKKEVGRITDGKPAKEVTGMPSVMLSKVIPCQRTVIVMCNASRYLQDASVIQGVMNVRESYKQVNSTLVLLSPTFTLPAEMKQDVMMISDPLPTITEISDMIKEVCTGNENYLELGFSIVSALSNFFL